MRRTFLLLCLTTLLSSCAAAVDSEVVTYNDVIESVMDKMLLANILRARDRAPLHFGDVPLIHESLTVGAGTGSSLLVGPLDRATLRSNVSPQLSLSASPSFDIDNVDTKDFATGLASPIDPKFVKYWLDKGVDPEIVLMLFFSSIEVEFADPETATSDKDTKGKEAKTPDDSLRLKLANAPRPTELDEEIGGSLCDKSGQCIPEQFLFYLYLINGIYDFEAAENASPTPIWTGTRDELQKVPNLLRDIASLDGGKLKLKPPKQTPVEEKKNAKKYQILPSSGDQQIIFCYGLRSQGDHKIEPCKADAQSPGSSKSGPNDIRLSRRQVLLKVASLLDKIQEQIAFDHHQPAELEVLIGKMLNGPHRTDPSGQNNRDRTYDKEPIVTSPVCDYDYQYNSQFLSNLENDESRPKPYHYEPGLPLASCAQQFGELLLLDLPNGKFNDNDRKTAFAELSNIDVWHMHVDVEPVVSVVQSDLQRLKQARKNGETYEPRCEPALPNEASPSAAGVWLCGRMDRADWERVYDLFLRLEIGSVACLKGKKPNADGTCKPGEEAPRLVKLTFSVRSVGEMIQFLGDVLWYGDTFEDARLRNVPITLSFCGTGYYSASPICNGGVLFQARNPPPDARFTVDYRGQVYGIAPESERDHSLQVLAIVNQLIALNKSATELRSTPEVQVLP